MAVDTLGRKIHMRPTPPPDPAPAQRLGELLARRRRQGLPWPDEAEFARLVELAVAFVRSPHDRLAWREVTAELRDNVWRAAYERRLEVRRGL